jgi:uncharacterized protein
MSCCLKLRAHHLFCIQGYQGYGYSDKFQANLERIIKLINTVSDLEIEVIAEKDIICSYCPHTGKTGCQQDEDSAEKIQSMDLKVLEKLNLKEGIKDKAQTLLMLTNTQIKTSFDIQEICGNCHWEEKCLWYQKLLHNA